MRAKRNHRLIVENSRDIIFVLNRHGDFIYVSPSINDELGYTPASLIGHPIFSLVTRTINRRHGCSTQKRHVGYQTLRHYVSFPPYLG